MAARVTCSTSALTPGPEESPEENGTRWMSFTGCARLRVERAGDEHLVDELLALQRRHARHAFAVRDADAVEVGIFLEHLRHALAQVSLGDVGGVARHVVVRIEVLLRDAVRLREFLAHEDAPEHHVGVEPALLGHAEDLAVQVLPLGELRVRPLAGLGKIPRAGSCR